jgi:hypothetical protein
MPDQTFNNWKKEINSLVLSEIQVNLEELPDLNYRDWYDNNNLTTKQISIIVLGEYYKDFDKNQYCKNLVK